MRLCLFYPPSRLLLLWSQLYMPVANALGLGGGLKEVEELSYRALFPDSYERFALWHQTFTDAAQIALLVVRHPL